MYTRKQFFHMDAKHCFDLAITCSLMFSLIKEDNKKEVWLRIEQR